MNDELLFAPEDTLQADADASGKPWKVLVVDDEEEVHAVTRMVLGDITFEGRPIECMSAYSAAEGSKLLLMHPDTALILLDVVMETNQAGLDLVRRIREEQGNTIVRIVLRTGQPGQAPEREVITRYDINDYKHKTELTSQRLFTTVIAALRGYRDLRIIERNRRGLERIINASRDIFRLQSLQEFMAGVLIQLTSSLSEEPTSVYLGVGGLAAVPNGPEQPLKLLCATGRFAPMAMGGKASELGDDVQEAITKAVTTQQSYFTDDAFVGYFRTPAGTESVIYIQDDRRISEMDKKLISLFADNVGVALENIYLNREIEETQAEVILTLGEVVENRSHEAANHVRRVAEYAALMARLYGLPEDEIRTLRTSAPMHDVGKIGIPDAVLLKPGRLTPEERLIMNEHAVIGHRILSVSRRPMMQAAGIVAHEHHERWDGAGYPRGLAGEAIHIFGRIVSMADVFDALICKRVYKDAWTPDAVKTYFTEQSGKAFDPHLADLLLDNFEAFLDIWQRFPDSHEG